MSCGGRCRRRCARRRSARRRTRGKDRFLRQGFLRTRSRPVTVQQTTKAILVD